MDDAFDLQRFIAAQDSVYAAALGELQHGAKRTHWMWFIFPQVAGLGRSDTARYYAIPSIAEAEAFLAHPVLGARLRECTSAVLTVPRSAQQIFGSPDHLKFRSSMTLFERVSGNPLFTAALMRFFGGQSDLATLQILGSWENGET